MKSNQTALCGVALSLAVAMYVVVRRARLAAAKPAVASVLQKDETVENARLASEQEFPEGALVKVHGHGTGRVVHYISPSKSYKVQLVDAGDKDGAQLKTVPAIHISHVKVKDLYIYPIKSCRGIRIENAVITERGIQNDRLWMFVDHKNKFITMRRYPKMALIAPQLDDIENPTVLTLTAPGMDDLRVPVLLEGQGEEIPTDVWGHSIVGINQGAAAARWINKYMEDVREDREFRLVRVKDSVKRPTSAKYAPGHHTGFADGYPFLLAADASVTEINEKLKEKITIDRFRANIIVTGAPGFADEHWNALTIGGLRFRNVKPCDRCQVPTVDPETGVAHPDREPRKTMTPFRNGVALGFKNGSEHAYYFGSNLVAESLGRISIGAPVKVLTTKEAVFA